MTDKTPLKGVEVPKPPFSPGPIPPDLMAAAVIGVSRDYKVTYVNIEALLLFGYGSPNALIGASVEKLIPKHLRNRHKQMFDAWFQDPKPRAMGQAGSTIKGLHSDHSHFPIVASLWYEKEVDMGYVIMQKAPKNDRWFDKNFMSGALLAVIATILFLAGHEDQGKLIFATAVPTLAVAAAVRKQPKPLPHN